MTGAVGSVTGGGASKGSSTVDVGALTTKGKGLMGKFDSAFVNMLKAQSLTAAALGLKKESDDLAVSAKEMASGNVDKGGIDRATTHTKDFEKAFAAKIAKKEPLDTASKTALASAVPHYVKGIAETVALPNEFKNYAQSVQTGIAGLTSSPMDAVKLKDGAATPLYVATKLPDLLSTFGETTKGFVAFAQSNDVKIPDDLSKPIGNL